MNKFHLHKNLKFTIENSGHKSRDKGEHDSSTEAECHLRRHNANQTHDHHGTPTYFIAQPAPKITGKKRAYTATITLSNKIFAT